jgi:8-oxo-dGTP pyrophosphatase MutT (NUDIX family)
MSKVHPKAQVVITSFQNNRFEVLLLKTNSKRGGFWQNMTGSVEAGEKFKQGALREVFEETGINENQICFIKKLFSFEFHDRFGRDVQERVYMVIVEPNLKITLDSNEHNDFRWYNIDEDFNGLIKYKTNLRAIFESRKIIHTRFS